MGAKVEIRTEELEKALELLAEGETLSEIAEELGFKRTTLLSRLTDADWSDKYAHAREAGLDARAEELERIASESVGSLPSGGIDSAAVAQLRLRVDTRKWMLSKLAAHKYGEKLEIKQETTITNLSEDELNAKLARLLEQGGKAGIAGAAGGEEAAQGGE